LGDTGHFFDPIQHTKGEFHDFCEQLLEVAKGILLDGFHNGSRGASLLA
jgi:hypothetical protein